MERVYAVGDRSAQQIDIVAVSVDQHRRHVGLLHKVDLSPTDSSVPKYSTYEVRLLHLGWHGNRNFENDTDLSLCAFWIAPDIEPEQGEAIAGYCRMIYRENFVDGIPYGFGSPEGFFGEEGKILPEAAKMGLTCATFVLALFHRGGVPLVRYSTWVFREEDRPFLNWVIATLKKTQEEYNIPEDHIERQAKAVEAGQARFRPLEVAGAATSTDCPIDMPTAEGLATELAAEFDRSEKPRPASNQ